MTLTRLTVPLVAGALLVAGCGSSQPSAQNRPPAGGMFSGANLTKLAGALGVSKAKLQSAMKASMPQGRPPQNGTPPEGAPAGGPPPNGGGGPGGGRLAAQLAKQLGVSEAKVTKALQSVAPAGLPSNG